MDDDSLGPRTKLLADMLMTTAQESKDLKDRVRLIRAAKDLAAIRRRQPRRRSPKEAALSKEPALIKMLSDSDNGPPQALFDRVRAHRLSQKPINHKDAFMSETFIVGPRKEFGEFFAVLEMPDGSGKVVKFDSESKSWVPDKVTSLGDLWDMPGLSKDDSATLAALEAAPFRPSNNPKGPKKQQTISDYKTDDQKTFVIPDDARRLISKWQKTLPPAEGSNGQIRYTYSFVNNGFCDEITVTDAITGKKFEWLPHYEEW